MAAKFPHTYSVSLSDIQGKQAKVNYESSDVVQGGPPKEFDGVDTILMSYLSVGEPEIGMKLVPIFQTKNTTSTILDLSWVPVGTKAKELPEGFTF